MRHQTTSVGYVCGVACLDLLTQTHPTRAEPRSISFVKYIALETPTWEIEPATSHDCFLNPHDSVYQLSRTMYLPTASKFLPLAASPKAGGGRKPNMFESMGLAGTTAVLIVNVTHPIEVVKTRLQVDKNFKMGSLIKNEGLSAFWKGIQAAWLREASYTSVKLGMYGPIREMLGASGKDAPFILKFGAGALSGSTGSMIGNPFDVMKTMMMANSKEKVPLPALMGKMLKEQGIGGFYRGIQANVARACVLNGTKMACYDVIKGVVVDQTGWKRKDPRCQFVSAIGAGFFMTCTVSPFDMMRTRLMNQPTDAKIYDGMFDCFKKILKNEGPLAFWRGFFPIWGRFAPQATLQLVTFEFLLKQTGFEAI